MTGSSAAAARAGLFLFQFVDGLLFRHAGPTSPFLGPPERFAAQVRRHEAKGPVMTGGAFERFGVHGHSRRAGAE